MTASFARPRTAHRAGRPARRDLLGRTALCGALMGFVAVASPGFAAPVWTGQSQVNAGGGLPTISSGPTTNVALNAPRTVIDWTSYNVAAGESVNYAFGARNWIVLNRIQDTQPTTIAGSITGTVNGAPGGNIWFASKSGMILGQGAQIDAGGILISTASPDLTGFLNPGNLTFAFPGDEVIDQPVIGMLAGSSITGHGGLVAIIAPKIVTEAGTSVTGLNGSNVLYGAATGFQLRLAQNSPGDFDLVDFIIPSSALGSEASVLMDLQNTTSANSVFVAGVSRTSSASAVINLEGMITAQAASTDGGDIILSGGGGIVGKQAGPVVAGGTSTDFYLRTSAASRDIVMQNTGHVFGQPWVRPPPPPTTPNPPTGVLNPSNGRDNGNGSNGSNGSNGGSGDDNVGGGSGDDDCFTCNGGPEALLNTLLSHTLHSVQDDSQVSLLTAGRDILLNASQTISLGSAMAARDLRIDGGALQANSLKAGGALALKSENGDVDAGSVSVAGASTINSAASVQVDSLNLTGGAPQTLTVQAAGNIGLGDGTGSAAGGTIVLTAGGGVTVDLASATLATVSAGGVANLQAKTLNVGAVTGSEVLLQGGTITATRVTSANDVYVNASGAATVGTATAGDDIYVRAGSGAASLANAVLTGAGADKVGPAFSGAPDAAGNGRVVSVQSISGDAILGSATGSVSGATAVSVLAGQDATVQLPTALPGALTVTAGRDASLTAPSVTFNAVTAGRDVSLMTTGGDFTSTAPLVATRNLSIGAAGALTVGNITAMSGSIALTGKTVTAGTLMAGQDLTLQASAGGVSVAAFQAGRDLIVQGSTLSLGQQLAAIGRDLSITTPGAFTAASDLTAGRNVTLSAGGLATLKGVNAPGNIDIVANDLSLGGALTAQNVQIESATGPLQVGGSTANGAPASGLWLDNAEFGQIHATGQVSLYAGPVAGTARGDLTILNLDVNPAFTPQVNFLAGPGHNALVQGLLAPTASGGIIHIGDSAISAWKPDSILVSGQIGAAAYSGGTYGAIRGFNDVRLFAANDIIIGSQRFISLIQTTDNAAIEIGRNKPAGVAPTGAEQNRVLVAAGTLELSATGKVVSQNTGATSDQSVGLFLTGKPQSTTVTPDLIIDPPQLVDLFGAFIGPHGEVVSSFAAGAGVAFAIVDSAGSPTSPPPGAVYRFDSCSIGTSQCSATASLTANLAQNTPVLTTSAIASNGLGADIGGGGNDDGGDTGDGASGGAKGASARAAGGRNSGPPLLAPAPAEADQALTDPVTTGAGSEEIWRRRAKDADKNPQGSKP